MTEKTLYKVPRFVVTGSSWLVKIEVDTKEDGEYILEHLQTLNPVLDTEMEELEC